MLKETEWVNGEIDRFQMACDKHSTDKVAVKVASGRRITYLNEVLKYLPAGDCVKRDD
ncbi:MAG TPA: hypothetical protein VFE47_13205 [Tepidisphaeraceae bacterium]|jgi:hypothetical protein|nr:hypothetical protein [Tepidisphaeraceae bacterium]